MHLKRDTAIILFVAVAAVAWWYYMKQNPSAATVAGMALAGYAPNDYNDGSAG